MHNVCKKSAKHRISVREVCTAGIKMNEKSALSVHESGLPIKESVQNVKKSMHKVCIKAAFYRKKCAFILPNAHFADLCTLLEKCA
jgi:hypothetical protein